MILNHQKKRDIDTRRAGRTLRRILKHLHCEGQEVTVVLLDDPSIRVFNKKYFARNRPTNVISFPMGEGDVAVSHPVILGDVLISVEHAEKDALRSGLPFDEILDYLMIHGVLHLLGYDHVGSPVEAGAMRQREEELFTLLHHRPIASRVGQKKGRSRTGLHPLESDSKRMKD